MATVTLSDVNKVYRSRGDAVHAVKDLSLEVQDGEFVALLGPSGCGKTSTLRMIVGLEEISAGEIAFDGRRVNELQPQQRNVAMAFETYALYPNFTVAENLGFPLEVLGLPQAERDKKVRAMADILQLEAILDQMPGALSGGQQQRVSLGRALIREPAVFILDEVMSHIDAHLKFRMLFDLKRIHRDMGRTMVYVTHDQVEALALADRVAVMSHAELQQVGTRNELYRTPTNVFVADFIGEPPTNFFTAALDGANGSAGLRVPDSDIVLRLHPDHAERVRATGADSFIVGLRPQNLRPDGDAGKDTLAAEVTISEYLGEQTILTLRNGASVLRALADPQTRVGRGDTMRLAYDPENVMVFDAATEDLIP